MMMMMNPSTTTAVLISCLSLTTTNAHPPPLPQDHQLLHTYGGHFRCPYSEKWLSKGPEAASRELLQEHYHRTLQGGDSIWGGPPVNASICDIAPGPIGAAHQAATSPGYLQSCPSTPAEGSRYQWPLRWSADKDTQSMAYGSDDVLYHSRGRVYYMLDRNWKRNDILYQNGTQRALGQTPCEDKIVQTEGDENDGGLDLSCERNTDQRTTVLHRGAKMVFLKWNNETKPEDTDDDVSKIVECTWLDLRVVGNIRPDWFMDDRGDSTDVQYLGDQHAYHPTDDGSNYVPRLVKQWRKTDFANQYFVMSMLANPDDETDGGINWPMILNIPGEGFGDDSLQSYTNHALLTDEDEKLFLLDEAYVRAGGTCPERKREGDALDGPPVGQAEHIPSNLEIDPNSWYSNVYTFSPVWVKPEGSSSSGGMVDGEDEEETGMATTVAGSVTVESCYDRSTSSAKMSVTYDDVPSLGSNGLPWLALSFRPDAECLMTPRGGGDGEIVLISTDEDGVSTASYGPMPMSTKKFDGDVVTSIYEGLSPLSSTDGFSDVAVEREGSSVVTLHFKREIVASGSTTAVSRSTPPEALHLTYAIGNTPRLGYHASRRCFEVVDFPPCPDPDALPADDAKELGSTSKVASSAGHRFSVDGRRSAASSVVTLLVSVLITLCFF